MSGTRLAAEEKDGVFTPLHKMIHVDQVTFSMKETVNRGNYESTQIMIGRTTDVQEDEDETGALKRITKYVKRHMARELKSLEDE